MNVNICTQYDVELLTEMNHMLIEDEKAENNMTILQLQNRMIDFLNKDYKAFFFNADDFIVGYALVNFVTHPLYLRQFFICREKRRMGYGRKAFFALLEYLKIDEIDIDVYSWNDKGILFWKSLGFSERFYNMRYKK